VTSAGNAAVNVSAGQCGEDFCESVVTSGRFGSANEIVREGLRLVEERETRLQALRAPIADGDPGTEDDMTATFDAEAAELAKAGF
jgi:antitoxin ParD1/3/4